MEGRRATSAQGRTVKWSMLPPAAAIIHHETQELSSGGNNGGHSPPAIAGNFALAGNSPQRNGLLLRALGQDQ
eukprot:6167960-Heterocapsa_arctica.AAC.1